MLLFLFLTGASMAQEILPSFQPEFFQKNQTGQYQVGDRIQLSVRIPLELSQQLTTAQLKNSDDKNSLDKQGWYLDPTIQVINGNLRFVVSPIKSGKLILPELLISTNESHSIAKTTSVNIDVAELKADAGPPPAFLDTISISLPVRFIIFGLSFLIICVISGVYLYRKFFANKPIVRALDEIKIPPKPDDEIALRDLNILYEKHPYSKENLKPLAFGISQILKNFFSARFKIDAKESTTDEMLMLLRQEQIPEQDLKKIRSLFQNLDHLKFTDYIHHQHFQKGDYLEFKDLAKSLIESWTFKGGGR